MSTALRGFYAKQMHDEQNPNGQKHPPQIIQCSLGRFCTTGVTATGVLHFLPIVVSMLDPTVATDIELLKWLSTPLFLFCLRVISQFSIVFEHPFLGGIT